MERTDIMINGVRVVSDVCIQCGHEVEVKNGHESTDQARIRGAEALSKGDTDSSADRGPSNS